MPVGTPQMKAIVLSRFTRSSFCSWLGLPVVLTVVFAIAAHSAVLKPFSQQSYAQIEHAYAGLPALVVIWSLDCPPCMEELDLLGKLKQEYPEFNLILINTDGMDAQKEVGVLLASFNLSFVDSWIFASEQVERLRFSIDPQWYGELPRSYLYNGVMRLSHSGLIDEVWLRGWLETMDDKPSF